MKGIWCYTDESTKEYCKPKTASDETCSGDRCTLYRGKQNTTISGRTCQAWNVDTPHTRLEGLSPEEFPYLEENYCRNPSDWHDTIWCYTTDTDKVWEFCSPIGSDWKYKDTTFGADNVPTLYWDEPYGLTKMMECQSTAKLVT